MISFQFFCFFSRKQMEEVQQVHYDIIHSKGAKGKLVLRVNKEDD